MDGLRSNAFRATGRAANVFREIALIHQFRTGSSRTISDLAPLLRPGDWFVLSASSRTHGGQVPIGLARDGCETTIGHDVEFHHAGVDRRFSRRYLFHVPAPSSSASALLQQGVRADIILLRSKGNVIGLDFTANKTLRLLQKPFTSSAELLRLEFQRHMPSVAFSVSADRMSLIEGLARGRPLGLASIEKQIVVIKNLLKNIVQLSRSAQEQPNASEKSLNLQSIIQKSPLQDARRYEHDLRAISGTKLPIIPIHGDMGSTNILVDDDSRASVIDMTELAPGPFLVDALKIAAMQPQALLNGAFNDELVELWESAGWPGDKLLTSDLELLFLLQALLKADQRLRTTRGSLRGLKKIVKSRDEQMRWMNFLDARLK